jgi:hypothetical protein
MDFLIGVVLALLAGISLTLLRMDRDRGVYPTILIVIALLYELFAAMGGSPHALLVESIPALIFIALAVAGFKSTLWFTVAGLALHGIWDFVHPIFIQNPGVPGFWPMFCSAYDVTAALYLGWLLSADRIAASPADLASPLA